MRKLVFCIVDGMAEEPALYAGGKTPLCTAQTPTMDYLARHSVAGLCHVIPSGMPAASDVGNMALMGYDPRRYYTGRAPFEALGIGVTPQPDDLVWRLSCVTLETSGYSRIMADAQGGGVSPEQGHALAAAMQAAADAEAPEFAVYEDCTYKHILVQRGGAYAPEAALPSVGPHTILGNDADAVRRHNLTPRLLGLTEQLEHAVRNVDSPANSVWLWGQGCAPQWPSFRTMHGLTAGVVAGISLLHGLGIAAGLERLKDARFTGDAGTDLHAKAEAARAFLHGGADAVFIHVDAPDLASHAGDADAKRRCIEAVDRELLAPLLQWLPDAVFVLTCDHRTDTVHRTHAEGPVPFLIYRSGVAENGCTAFSESAVEGGEQLQDGPALLERAKLLL